MSVDERGPVPASAKRRLRRKGGGGVGGDALVPGAAGEHGGRRLAQAEGVDRLDQPAVGVGAPGEEDIGVAVEQHDEGQPGEAVGAALEAQRQARRHPPHVADLQVEHHEVGDVGLHRAQHVGASAHPTHLVVAAEGGLDLVVDPVGVSGEQHVGHGGRRYRDPGAGRRPPARSSSGPVTSSGDNVGLRPVSARGASGTLRGTPRRRTHARRGPLQEDELLEIQVEESADHTVCRPVGELDAYTVGQFRESLAELSSVPRLLIDLSAVPFMDSAGLGALIGGIRRAREAGGDVAVACSRPTLTRLLHTTGFDRIVPVTETVEEAALALAASQ